MKKTGGIFKALFFIFFSVVPVLYAADWEQVDGPYEGHVNSFVRDSGTGKIYATAMGIGLGGGVFVSSDNGNTWNRVAGNSQIGETVYNDPPHYGTFYENIGLPDVTGIPVGNLRLGIDPATSPNTLYIAYFYSNAPSKVMRSTDEGNTWTDFSAGLPTPGSHSPHAFARAPNGDMFLATKGAKGVYRLPAGTSTWVACTTTASGLWAMDIAVDQNNGDIYYTSYASSAAGRPAVFRSVDNGTSFIETVMNTSVVGAGAADAGSYNRLLSSIAIDNTVTPPVIHMGLKERYQWMTQQPVASGGYFRSVDYGATWVSGTAMNVECLTVDSAGRVFLGTGNASNFYGAVYMSVDKGLNYTKIIDPGIADTANVVGIEALASGAIFAGADGAYRSMDNGATWTHLTNKGLKATRRSVDIDIATDGTIYSVSNEHGVSVSNDNGATWTIANGSGASRIGSLYVNSIDVDPVTGYVYAGTGLVNSSATGLWRSVNKGASWTKVSGFTPQYKTMATVFAQNGNIVFGGMFGPAGVFVSSNGGISGVSNTAMDAIYSLIVNPINGDIYAGTETKATWLSTDHGVTFQQLTYTTAVTNGCTGQLGNKGNIFGMTFDALGNTLYTAALHGLFKTSDKGVSFQEVAVPGLGGCGQTGTYAFTDAAGNIYYGYTEGSNMQSRIQRSSDNGLTWNVFNSGLPLDSRGIAGVSGMFYNPTDGKVYAGVAGPDVNINLGTTGLFRTILAVYTPGATATVTPVWTVSATPTVTYTVTPAMTNTHTFTATESVTNTFSFTSTALSSQTNTPVDTATFTQTNTITQTFTQTFTQTITMTATITPPYTATITPTDSETATITLTPTESATHTVTTTYTESLTATQTGTQMPSSTQTEIFSATETPTSTLTQTYTFTPDNTATLTVSHTSSLTSTPSYTTTATNTFTQTPVYTATATPVDTASATQTNTVSLQTPTYTPTATVMPLSSSAEITIYPNPAKGAFAVYFKNAPAGDMAEVRIYTRSFRLVRKHEFTPDVSNIYAVNLEGLSTGIYIMRAGIKTAGKEIFGRTIPVIILK